MRRYWYDSYQGKMAENQLKWLVIDKQKVTGNTGEEGRPYCMLFSSAKRKSLEGGRGRPITLEEIINPY